MFFFFFVFRLNALSSQCENILAANEKRVHSILSLLVDIYLQLVVVSDPAMHKWKTHDGTLGGNVTHILNILFNNGSPGNVQVAAQKLKVRRLNRTESSGASSHGLLLTYSSSVARPWKAKKST